MPKKPEEAPSRRQNIQADKMLTHVMSTKMLKHQQLPSSGNPHDEGDGESSAPRGSSGRRGSNVKQKPRAHNPEDIVVESVDTLGRESNRSNNTVKFKFSETTRDEKRFRRM